MLIFNIQMSTLSWFSIDVPTLCIYSMFLKTKHKMDVAYCSWAHSFIYILLYFCNKICYIIICNFHFSYNRAHRSTRNIIERLNGVWKQRFPCLRRKLLTKPVTTQSIIVSCAILNNIGILRRDMFENIEEDPLEVVPVANANAAQNPRGRIVRQQFIERHFYWAVGPSKYSHSIAQWSRVQWRGASFEKGKLCPAPPPQKKGKLFPC